MKLFTVGPVEMEDEIRLMGSDKIPYFRTAEFSGVMNKIEDNIKAIVKAPEKTRVAILTASGTGAMEAAVSNVLDQNDKVLVIVGGSFGHRFEQLCQRFQIPYDALNLQFGDELTEERLSAYEGKEYSALLVNLHETSTGQLYNIDLLSAFCKRNHTLLIVDAISTLLADPFDMKKSGADVVIASSQKALALPPGISFIVSSERANERIMNHSISSIYFDLKDYFSNMDRGQTPFTPAVGIILQMARKLERVLEQGVDAVVKEHENRAQYFRKLCLENGIDIMPYPKSNALTPLYFPKGNAYDVFLKMKEEYDMMLTPNGGELSKTVLRVGHLGHLEKTDYDLVIEKLKEIL